MMNGTRCNSSNNNSCEDYYDDFCLHDSSKYWLVVPLLLSFLGTTGNGLVIWFCLFRMEKTVSVIWFLNLAIADFIFALHLSLAIILEALQGHWAFGKHMFVFTMFVFFLNMAISVLQLTVISVDRCLCVVFPVWCRNHRTRRLALIFVLIIWVISISSHLIIFIYRHTEWIAISRFLFFFLLPFIVIFSSYTILILRIKDKRIIKTSKPFKIIVAMVIAFFICWFPYYLFVLLKIFALRKIHFRYVYEPEKQIILCLMFSNCCINPILYVFIGQDFKQKCCGSFQAVFEKAFREDMGPVNFTKHDQLL